MTQLTFDDLPPESQEFDGETFDKAVDGSRLRRQLNSVRTLMWDEQWRTLSQIALGLGYPEASISARLRDLRKPKFGGYVVERKRATDQSGLFLYRLVRTNAIPENCSD
jgi:hypothetical protein